MGTRLRVAAITLLSLALSLGLAGWALVASLALDEEPVANPDARAADLDYLRNTVPEKRGRILVVLTSTERFDDGRRKAGYELTEVSRAWWVFVANGFEVVLASPRGGEPTMVLDRDDVTDADYAFLNDPAARRQLVATRTLASIDPAQFDGVYFAGGKGAMFDFPGNRDIARIVRDIAPRGVVGAVCHGPAALLGIELEPGVPLLRGRRVTGFTNAEETFLIEQARDVFPYLLQDELARQGGRFVEAPMFLENVVVDGRVVTGQNPWSTWAVAEAMVRALRHAPVHRAPTPEEASVGLLATYHARGVDAALAQKATGPRADKRLLAMHAVVAAMEWRLGRAWDLHRLARR